MAGLTNLIPDSDAQFRLSPGNWQVSNATIAIDLDNIVDSRFGSLRLQPLVEGSPVVLYLAGVPVRQIYANDTCQFHARQKSSSTCLTTITLTNSNGDTAVRVERTGIQVWSIIRSALFPIPDIGEDVTVNVEVSICEHNLQPIYFTIPVLFPSTVFFRDLFLRQAFAYLPEVIRQTDLDHATIHDLPDLPLSRLMQLTTGDAGDALRDYYRFQYLDIEQGKNPADSDTLSALVDPNNADATVLPWLAQFAGVRLDNPVAGTTPWGNLPSTWDNLHQDIDPTANPVFTPSSVQRSANVVTATIGAHSIAEDTWISLSGSTSSGTSFNGNYQVSAVDSTTISWSQDGVDESALTVGVLTVIDAEWDEVETFDTTPDGLLDYLRWQVKYAYNGVNGGTLQALTDSVSISLTGDKIVTVLSRYEDNPWKVLVRTKTSETPNGTEGNPSSTIESYISKVKPAGFEILHECTSTGT